MTSNINKPLIPILVISETSTGSKEKKKTHIMPFTIRKHSSYEKKEELRLHKEMEIILKWYKSTTSFS